MKSNFQKISLNKKKGSKTRNENLAIKNNQFQYIYTS